MRRRERDIEDDVDAYQRILAERGMPSSSDVVFLPSELWGPSDDERSIAAENGAYAGDRFTAIAARRFARTDPHLGPANRPPPERVPFSADVEAAVWDKTGGTCRSCGIQTDPYRDFAIDHVFAVGKGGGDGLGNLVPCCRPCNCRKGDRGPKKG